MLDTGGSEEEYIYVSLEDVTSLTLRERGYDVVEVSVSNVLSQLNAYIDQINDQVTGLSARLVKRVTASESTTLSSFSHSRNALSATASFGVSHGRNTTSFRAVHFPNAHVPIDDSPVPSDTSRRLVAP